jgi:hypothetical protein
MKKLKYKQLTVESQSKDLVLWGGTNLGFRLGSGRITKQIRDRIKFAPFHFSVLIGLVLYDACLIFSSPKHKNAHLEFEQSLAHSEYL